MQKILFLSNYAGRTGAPIVLLNFVRWLKRNTDIPIEIVHLQAGELLPEFQSLAPTTVCGYSRIERNLHRLFPVAGAYYDRLCGPYKRLARRLSGSDVALIYSNTLANGKALAELASLKSPMITHVHELELMIQRLGPENMDLVKKHTAHYIAVSRIAKQNLMEAHHIPEDKIDVVSPFVDIQRLPSAYTDVKARCNIPAHAFIVCGAGQGTIWGKGMDLFIQLAGSVARKCSEPPIHFFWIGTPSEKCEAAQLEQDIQRSGLSGIVHFISTVAAPFDFYNACDVFALVSREESFGMASVEAAALGKPIICFEGASSIPEFVERDAGYAVPYLNVEAMAEIIILLAHDAALRAQLGTKAAEKARQRHDAAVACPAIFEIMQRFLR